MTRKRSQTRSGGLVGVTSVNVSPSTILSQFPPLTPADLGKLPRQARSLLAGLLRIGTGAPVQAGQDRLAVLLGIPLRTLQRWTQRLDEVGFIRIRRMAYGAPWQVFLHPLLGELVARGESIAEPARPRGALRLASDSVVVRCARVRRRDGSRFLSTSVLVDLLTDHERAVCAYAAATEAGPICVDRELSDDLLERFRRIAWGVRFRAAELARAAMLRDLRTRDDVPHFIADHDDGSEAVA